MDHSLQSYLRRRTTEELIMIMNTEGETIPPEILTLVANILQERQECEQADKEKAATAVATLS